VSIREHLVTRDGARTFRWYDAIGPDVIKYKNHFLSVPADDQTYDPTAWTNTIVEGGAGDSTVDIADAILGGLLITAAEDENDGYQMQLGHGAGGVGENFTFSADYPTYFGVRLQSSDADQTDILAGLCITDTTLLGGLSDGLYFRSVDESALVYFVLEQDSVESVYAVGTVPDTADITLEFLYYNHNIYAAVDGVLMATVADTDANFPNDELLRLSLAFLCGEGGANSMQVAWVRAIQIQN
ncbi:unnamed protein product, partial [marine sediment metagenome]